MKKQLGLTLIEVLVALAILAIAFLAVMMTYNSSVRATHYLQSKTIAEWVALDVIARAKVGLIKIPYAPQIARGNINWFQQEWNWSLTQVPTDNKAIFRMEVEVRDVANTKLISVSAYRNRWMP